MKKNFIWVFIKEEKVTQTVQAFILRGLLMPKLNRCMINKLNEVIEIMILWFVETKVKFISSPFLQRSFCEKIFYSDFSQGR